MYIKSVSNCTGPPHDLLHFITVWSTKRERKEEFRVLAKRPHYQILIHDGLLHSDPATGQGPGTVRDMPSVHL